MENKMKDQKPGFVCKPESQTNDVSQNKQDNGHVDSGPNSNQQQQTPIVQWPYTHQNATEQFLSMHFHPQTSPPGALNQWQQLPHPQMFAQSTSPFWQSRPPVASGPLLGANVPTTQTLVANMGYLCSFPGFPRSWDPTSYMAQLYQMQHPYVYFSPGAPNFSSAAPKVPPDCSASGEHSSQRGIIRPPVKLSQKHQQLWDAQSAENVHLWSVINKLQAEVSNYKDQLKKLEDEVSSLKQKPEVPKKVIGTIPVGTAQVAQQPRKRGRPKRSESHLQAGGGNPAPSNYLSQNKSPLEKVKSPIFEKVILKKVENKDIAIRFTSPKESNVNILNAVKDVNSNIQISQSHPIMSAYQGQVHEKYQGVQVSGSGPPLCSTSEANVNFGKDKESKHVYSEQSQSQPQKVLNNGIGDSVSAKHVGNACNGNSGWTSGLPSQVSANVLLDYHPSLFHNAGFIQQGRNITSGWNLDFANEEDASEDSEHAMEGSAKDENEVMEDVTSSSSAEDILV